jgi:hypothetical protein
VTDDRLARVLALLSPSGRGSPATGQLCQVAADVTLTSGAGIMLLSDDRPQGSLCTTDDVSALLEELQYTFGEGPCVDAHTHGVVVLEPDLAVPGAPRWPAFSPAAAEVGVGAVFGFPVRVGAARLGALNLYRDRPGPLSGEQHADAVVVADAAARVVLALQADAPPGTVAAGVEAEADFQFVVHQAAGMVSIQLDIGVGEALLRLRSHALRTHRLVADVARDVVNRRLRLDDRMEK